MSLPVYSSKDVTVKWQGKDISGLAPDSFVTFSRNSDLTDEEVGSDGLVSVSKSADRTGACTITLQQQSIGAKVLAEAITLQETTSTLIRGALTVKDPSGAILADLSNCHLKTAPEITLGNSATGSTRAFVFFAESIKFTAAPIGSQLTEQLKQGITDSVDAMLERGEDIIGGVINKEISKFLGG